MACNRNCRQGRDCDCRPPAVDPVVFHVINTTADAGARVRLTDEAVTLARNAQAHTLYVGKYVASALRARQRRAVA